MPVSGIAARVLCDIRPTLLVHSLWRQGVQFPFRGWDTPGALGVGGTVDAPAPMVVPLRSTETCQGLRTGVEL